MRPHFHFRREVPLAKHCAKDGLTAGEALAVKYKGRRQELAGWRMVVMARLHPLSSTNWMPSWAQQSAR